MYTAAGGMPHLKPTDLDAWKPLALCRQQKFPARRNSSSTAAPADAWKPIPLAEQNDAVAGTTLIATVCNEVGTGGHGMMG